MAREIADAQARWDTDSDPRNPGWVVDVTFTDGTEETYAGAPEVYHDPETANPEQILAATLTWEGLCWPADEETTMTEHCESCLVVGMQVPATTRRNAEAVCDECAADIDARAEDARGLKEAYAQRDAPPLNPLSERE